MHKNEKYHLVEVGREVKVAGEHVVTWWSRDTAEDVVVEREGGGGEVRWKMDPFKPPPPVVVAPRDVMKFTSNNSGIVFIQRKN